MHPAFNMLRIRTMEQRTDDLRDAVAEMQRQRDLVKRQRLLLRSTADCVIENNDATMRRALFETSHVEDSYARADCDFNRPRA